MVVEEKALDSSMEFPAIFQPSRSYQEAFQTLIEEEVTAIFRPLTSPEVDIICTTGKKENSPSC
jgi:hypothetical protein